MTFAPYDGLYRATSPEGDVPDDGTPVEWTLTAIERLAPDTIQDILLVCHYTCS